MGITYLDDTPQPSPSAGKGITYLDDSPSPEGLIQNAGKNAMRILNPQNLAVGLMGSVKDTAIDLPKDIMNSAFQSTYDAVSGKDSGQTPLGKRFQDIEQSEEVQHPGQWAYKNPLDAALQAGTLLSPLFPEGQTLQRGADTVAEHAERLAQQQAIKAMEGTRGQVMQIGPEAARELGQFALDKGIVSPLKGEIGMERILNDLNRESGTAIGKAREIGDLAGGAPNVPSLISKIEQELRPSYAQGMRKGETGALNNAIKEVQKLQKVERIDPEIPSTTGTQEFTAKEPNPLYTPGPKTLDVQNPIGQPPIQGFEKMPPWYQQKLLQEQAASEWKVSSPNPDYLSDLEQLSSEQQIPRHGFEDYRAAQEQGTLDPEYRLTEPTFSDIAGKATEMNKYAKGLHQLNQPSGALTDVANIISRENDAALEKALTPEQLSAYKTALSDYGSTQKLQQFFLRKEAREMAGRGGGIMRGIKDAIGHKATAVAADQVADLFSNPAVAKALPALSAAAKAGPSALETTHYMLQKNDPEYAEATGNVSGTEPSKAPVDSDQILSRVIADPEMAKWHQSFQEAAQRGPQAVTANHFILMQKDPSYNKAFTEGMNGTTNGNTGR